MKQSYIAESQFEYWAEMLSLSAIISLVWTEFIVMSVKTNQICDSIKTLPPLYTSLKRLLLFTENIIF